MAAARSISMSTAMGDVQGKVPRDEDSSRLHWAAARLPHEESEGASERRAECDVAKRK